LTKPKNRVGLPLLVRSNDPSTTMDESPASPRLPQFVAELEAELQSSAPNLDAREQLIDYYYEQLIKSDATWGGPLHDAWSRHVYWVIQHNPGSKLAGSPRVMVQPPYGTEEDYDRGKQLWLSQTELHSDDPVVLRNAAYYLQRNDQAIAQSLLEVAYSLRPGDHDIAKLLSSVYRRIRAYGDLSEKMKHELARKALAMGEESLNAPPVDRFYRLDDVAEAALEAGELDKAGAYAQELLDAAPKYESNWNYGNAIHDGNLVLGRIALQAGNVQKAGEFLLKAGETRGSPQLDSFGPDMRLAKELLENGQRDVVVKYFDLCGRFWEMGQDRLRSWRSDVEQGRVPEFGT
jgi:tetratricopeptide (TPR) repeat protein